MEVAELIQTENVKFSTDELSNAFVSFSDPDWVRIRNVARMLSKKCTLQLEELISEAVVKALSGERECPRNASPIAFFCNAMRSIAHNDRVNKNNSNIDDEEAFNNAEYGSEADVLKMLDARQLLKKIEDLFTTDEECTLLIMTLAEDMSKQEIMETLNINETAYETIRKRFRRALQKAFPEGVAI